MNKKEILEKIKSNVVRVLSEDPVRQIAADVCICPIKVLITVEGGMQEQTQEFYVIDEGLETESASFVNGREVKNIELLPPSREKKLLSVLTELQKQGTVKGVDLSQLQIPFAQLEVNGVKVFVAELAGHLIQLESV